MKTNLKELLLIGTLLLLSTGSAWADEPLLFAKPEQAVESLKNSTTAPDLELFRQLFGSDLDNLVSVDPEVRRAAADKLRELFAEGWSLTDTEGGQKIVRLGAEGWAFPVPLTRGAAGWHFDTLAGIEEIKNRTIGRNELLAIQAMRILSDAQEAYRLKDYSGDGKKVYADRIVSEPGKKNGLYWPETGGDISPLETLLRDHDLFSKAANDDGTWHGYKFRLSGDGESYTLIAWPASYGESGVMSFFLTSSDGLYEADLGQDGRPTGEESVTTDGETWTLVDSGY